MNGLNIRLKELKEQEKEWLKFDGEEAWKHKQLNYTRARIDELEMAIKVIKKAIDKWFDSYETCSGKPHCCVEECDLCMNCFDDLKKELGVTK